MVQRIKKQQFHKKYYINKGPENLSVFNCNLLKL